MKINLVLLAAGNSRRFGGNKLLSIWGGKPLYLSVLEKYEGIPFHKNIVVTQYEEIGKAAGDKGFDTVYNKNPELGISHSIALGIKACGECDAIMFSVCDQPYLKRKSILLLIDTFYTSGRNIACMAYGEKLGNPVIFDFCYKRELLALAKDTGGKAVVKRHIGDTALVFAEEERELMDIDTREDFKK